MGIDERLKALERRPQARDMPTFFKNTYIASVQANYVTDGSADLGIDINEYAEDYAKANGTLEEFVKQKMEQWQRQHNNGGTEYDL
jgi:hypothetical protein